MLRCRGEFTRVGYDISPLKTGVKASPSQDKKITCAMASLLAVDMSFEPSGRKTKKKKKKGLSEKYSLSPGLSSKYRDLRTKLPFIHELKEYWIAALAFRTASTHYADHRLCQYIRFFSSSLFILNERGASNTANGSACLF